MQVVVSSKMQSVTMPASAKSLVVARDDQRRLLVIELLNNMGFNTIESETEIPALEQYLLANDSTQNLFLVFYAEALSELILQQLKDLLACRTMPVLVLIDELDQELMTKAMQAGVSAFISLSMQGNRMENAIYSAFANFDVVSNLQQQISSLEDRLNNRIIIDKAKGLIMKNRGLDESEAYDYLRKYAMKKGHKLLQVAEMTIATAELLDKDHA